MGTNLYLFTTTDTHNGKISYPDYELGKYIFNHRLPEGTISSKIVFDSISERDSFPILVCFVQVLNGGCWIIVKKGIRPLSLAAIWVD